MITCLKKNKNNQDSKLFQFSSTKRLWYFGSCLSARKMSKKQDLAIPSSIQSNSMTSKKQQEGRHSYSCVRSRQNLELWSCRSPQAPRAALPARTPKSPGGNTNAKPGTAAGGGGCPKEGSWPPLLPQQRQGAATRPAGSTPAARLLGGEAAAAAGTRSASRRARATLPAPQPARRRH